MYIKYSFNNFYFNFEYINYNPIYFLTKNHIYYGIYTTKPTL